MKLKILLTTLIIFCVSAAVFADEGVYARRLKICNPYRTTYKDSQGRYLKKGIIGAVYKSFGEQPYCYYYVEESPNNYNLCYISVTDLKKDPIDINKATCRITDKAGVKQAYREIGTSNYLLQRAIIKSTDF